MPHANIGKTKAFYQNLKKDKDKYKKYIDDKTNKRKNTNIKKHGVPFPQTLEKTKAKAAETLIKKYGSVEKARKISAKKSIKTRMQKYGKIHYCPMFSHISQSLFKELSETLLKIANFTIYYATNGNDKTNEFQVLIENGTVNLRFLDFYVLELNKCIEFDEKHHNYNRQKEYDLVREKEIITAIPNISILHIKEDEYENNKDATIAKCVLFLLEDLLNDVIDTIKNRENDKN